MQIIGSGQIVTGVTSVVPTFLNCIALLIFYFCLALLLLLFYSLECAGEFRLCGGDHGLCPLDSHKPLIKAKPVFAAAQTFLRKASRLDRNFKCLGALGTYDRGGNVSYSSRQTSNRRPNKNKKIHNYIIIETQQSSSVNSILNTPLYFSAIDLTD